MIFEDGKEYSTETFEWKNKKTKIKKKTKVKEKTRKQRNLSLWNVHVISEMYISFNTEEYQTKHDYFH